MAMLDQIEKTLPEFSRAESVVARWVLQHPRKVAKMTLAELAQACQSSEPSVVRFCRRLKVDGYREFTRKLTQALSQPQNLVHRDVSSSDSQRDAVLKVLDASIQALLSIRTQVDTLPIDQCVNAMANARQLVFAGLGASAQVAADACQKFFRLGTPCSALTDTPMMLQFAAIAEPRDVLVLISNSGRWPETILAAEKARERGAIVLALTAPNTPLANSATLNLACEGIEDSSVYTPMSSRLAQLALLDALQVALALQLGESAAKLLQRSKDALQTGQLIRRLEN